MAASANQSHLMHYLKASFPQVSDDIIWRVMTKHPNNYQACCNALQSEQQLRYHSGQRMMSMGSVDMREKQNANGEVNSTPQKHRYSEPNVVYQRNISETSINLESHPVSAPPDRSTFNVPYALQKTPPPFPYAPPYHNRSAPPPVRSYSTMVINQPDRHSPLPWTDPQKRYATNDGHTNSSIQPRENTMISTMQFHMQNNTQNTPTSSRTALHHTNSSPILGRQLYQGNKQLKEMLKLNPNNQVLSTPITPIISPATSLNSLTDSPEVVPDLKIPPLPITKEQEEYAYTQALLLHQRMRYERLEKDYDEEKEILEKLKAEVESMEKQLAEKRAIKSAQCTAKTITRLSEENRQLAIDIECMTREIELHKNQDKYQSGFYENIGYTGAPGPVQPGHPDLRAIIPHCQVPSVREDEDGYLLVMEADDDQQWSCSACTFLNHPALSKCETCDSPRV